MTQRMSLANYHALLAAAGQSTQPPRHRDHDALLRQILTLARLCGYLGYHTHDSRRSAPGYPDLCLVGHGRLIFSEVKTGSSRLTLDQAAWLEALQQVTGPPEIYVWRPEDWESITACLQRGVR